MPTPAFALAPLAGHAPTPPCRRLARGIATTCSALLVATVLGAQPAPQFGTLVVEARAELYGTTYRIRNVQTCVGNATDPKAYGIKWTGLDGRATHTIPLGAQVYVTSDLIQGAQGFGHLQGQRINYVLKSSGLTLPMTLARTRQPGPNCSTPIGREPSPIPSKSLPEEETDVPQVVGTLKVLPGAVVTSPTITLYTTSGSPHFIEVSGVPTHWRLTASATAPQASSGGWQGVSIQGWGRLNAITANLIAEGKQTLHYYLKNAAGVSTGVPVEVTYVDTRPCVLEWSRSTGDTPQGSAVTESFTIPRGGNKGWAGDGMRVRSWKNKGPHTLIIGFNRVDWDGQQSAVKVDTLPMGASGWGIESAWPWRHAKYADCK